MGSSAFERAAFGINPRQNGEWTPYSNERMMREWHDHLLPHSLRVTWKLMLFAISQPLPEHKAHMVSDFAELAEQLDGLLRGKRPGLVMIHLADKKYYCLRCAVTLADIASWSEPPEEMHHRFEIELAAIIVAESKSPHHHYIYRG